MSPKVYVYCGPTIGAAEVTAMLPAAVPLPSVQHGDLLALGARPGDTVVIIDGLFHQHAAVRHKEILDLLDQDVTVIGAASMGALRAAELHPYGMIGAGAIYAAYRDGTLTADDEVAVAVAADGHTAVTEAMVDVRDVLARAEQAGILGQAEAAALARRAHVIHYTARTWAAISAAARPDLDAAAARLRGWRERSRPMLVAAKRRDAREALNLAATQARPPAGTQGWRSSRWDNRYLGGWRTQFGGWRVDGQQIGFGDVLRYQQIYDPGFPGRWRTRVLSWISDCEAPQAAGRAAAIAETGGLSTRYLTPEQLSYWLTSAELSTLDSREQLLRILVRAVPQDLTATIWPITARQAGVLITAGSDQDVAAAFRLNLEIAGMGPGRGVAFLRADLIRDHLAAVWSITAADEQVLTAAARDRGFKDVAAAVDAARPFFLHAIGASPAGLPVGQDRRDQNPAKTAAGAVPQ